MDYIVLAINQLTKNMHWPCYWTVHVYVVIHVSDSMRASWVEADMFFHCLFICIAVWGPILSREEFMIPLTNLTPPNVCACPKPGPWFRTQYVVVIFVFNDLRWEMVVRFVDISEIVDHYFLNIFYMNSSLVFNVVRITRSLVLCVCFVDRCLSFVLFRFLVYSSIYGFWFLPLWYLIISHISTYICKTQIHVQSQIRALSSHMCLPTNPCSIKLLYPQIRVLLPRKSVSFGILTQICVLPNRFSLSSVSFTLAEKWRHDNCQLITSFEVGIWKDGGTAQYTGWECKERFVRGKIFVINDINSNFTLELNRYQLRQYSSDKSSFILPDRKQVMIC
jgi:hypothetical protein